MHEDPRAALQGQVGRGGGQAGLSEGPAVQADKQHYHSPVLCACAMTYGSFLPSRSQCSLQGRRKVAVASAHPAVPSV